MKNINDSATNILVNSSGKILIGSEGNAYCSTGGGGDLPVGSAGTALVHNGEAWTAQSGYGYEQGGGVSTTIDSKFIPEKPLSPSLNHGVTSSVASGWAKQYETTLTRDGWYMISAMMMYNETPINGCALMKAIPSASSYDHILAIETTNGSRIVARRSVSYCGCFNSGDVIQFWVSCGGSASNTWEIKYAFIGNTV